MTFFLGHNGNVRLRRDGQAALSSAISPDDVNTNLNRLGFDGSLENILTGDRLVITTEDARGLVCFATSAWSSAQVEKSISAYVNVNAAGGLRFFASFAASVNNVRAQEYTLAAFAGAPLSITASIKDSSYNVLGSVTGYTVNTDREAIETTTLSDRFRQQYSAGLISGSGSIDCLFSLATTGIAETPLLMLQLIQRIEIGSAFDCALYLTESANADVFYELTALVTRSGVEVRSDALITCTLDFVTTGEIRLLVGSPSGYVLQENDDRIVLDPSLDYLLTETED
jgi:hypothetical protein